MNIDWRIPLGGNWSSLDTELVPPFEHARHRTWANVLDATRLGNLPANWRDRVEADARHADDAERLAALDIVSSGCADWEPHATHGDWRAALVAWHSAQVRNENTYELSHQQQLDIATSSVRRHLSHADAGPLRDSLQFELRRLETLSAHRLRRVARRDFLDASYRAGLVAGGGTGDWLGWYRNRVEQWAVDDAGSRWKHLKARHLSEFDSPLQLIATLQRLPGYWTQRP